MHVIEISFSCYLYTCTTVHTLVSCTLYIHYTQKSVSCTTYIRTLVKHVSLSFLFQPYEHIYHSCLIFSKLFCCFYCTPDVHKSTTDFHAVQTLLFLYTDIHTVECLLFHVSLQQQDSNINTDILYY
jgi:hypothetical protein